MKLRGYQQRSVSAILDAWQRHRSTLLVLPTGCGKTVTAAHALLHRNHGKVVWMAHREELLHQAKACLATVLGDRPEIEQAGSYAVSTPLYGPQWRCLCTTVQTQVASWRDARRMHRFSPSDFGTLVIDEAHHGVANSYRAVIEHYGANPQLRVLGLTATPDRHDRKALGAVFESCAFEYGICDAIEDGWLVPIDVTVIEDVTLDFGSVETSNGDLKKSQACEVVEKQEAVQAIVWPAAKKCAGRKTIVFAISVEQAELIAHVWDGYEPGRVAFICAKTDKDERRNIIERFRSGSIRVLVNVGVATEGFDVPDVEAIVVARPTRSRALFAQMVGRGLRPLPGLVDDIADEDQGRIDFDERDTVTPSQMRRRLIARSGKPKLLVVEMTDNSDRHSLASVADVLGGDYDLDEVELAKRVMRERSARGENADADEALRISRRRLKIEQLKVRRGKWRERKADPFSVFSKVRPDERGWQKNMPATDAQVALLRKFGVPTDRLTKRQASVLIGECLTRAKKRLCTYKQAKLLARYGYDVTNMTRERASKLIDALKANGWRPLARN